MHSDTEILLARNAGTTRTTTKRKAQKPRPSDAQQRASRQQQQSPKKERQAKLSTSSSSASKLAATGSSKLAELLGSPVIRNVLAAGLVSAAAALVYRKPKGIAAAGGHVQEAASEILDNTLDVARATRKTARKVRQKVAVAVEAVASPSAAPGAKPTQPVGNSSKGTPDAQAPATRNADRPKRKRRSDAGVSRASRARPPMAGASIGSAAETTLPLTNLPETETSAFALGAASAEANPVPDSADEPVVQADPS